MPPAGKGSGTVCLATVGSAFPSAWLVRSICKRSAASPRSSVAAMVSGIVATGVTWPPTPWRGASRAARDP